MDHTEAWVSLDLIPNIGPKSATRLVEMFGSPENVLCAPFKRIKEAGTLTSAQLKGMARGPDREAVRKVLAALREHGASAVPLDDPLYPAALKGIDDPPIVLYVNGSLCDLEPSVAVVGTRAPSRYGKDTAYRLSRDLAMKGVAVVSGLARGVDTAAHTGALDGEGRTVAVLGSGIDVIYPPENARLAERITKGGAVVSEYPPGTHPDVGNFPRRNRIISGLSSAVVVVEAAFKSGALITSRLAGEQGRTVMAVPGAVTNVRSEGPHHLIRQGAVLVRNAEDVIMEIAHEVKRIIEAADREARAVDEIVDLVAGTPLSIDDIAHELGIDITGAAKRLSMLELKGEIVRIEGNRFMARSTNG